MADSDKTLKLLIEMGVIGKEDVAAANGLLAETGTAAAASANAATDLGGAHKKLATETHGAADASKEHNVHLQGGRMIFKELNHLVPELGHLTHASFVGMAAPVILLSMALVKIKEHIAETNEELDKMGEKASEAYASVKTNLFDAIREEKFSTEKVDAYFKNFDDKAEESKKKIENLLALMKAEKEGQEEKNKADEAAQIDAVKKAYAGAKVDDKKPGAKEENVQLKKQEEDDINAIKDRFAAQNAELKKQGEQAGVTAAQAIYEGLEKELQGLLAASHGQEDPAQRNAKIKDGEQEVAALKAQRGINETTGVAEKGGAAEAAKKAREESDEAVLTARTAREFLGKLKENPAMNVMAIADQEERVRKASEAAVEAQGKSEAAALVLQRENKRIEQLEDSIAALKQSADAEKKLKAEIEKYEQKVREAEANLHQTGALADIKQDSLDYVTRKNAQHGKDITAVGNFDYDGPKGKGLSIEQAMAALHYSEAQKQLLIEKILNHAVNTTDAWQILNLAVDALERRTANGRNGVSG